MVSPDIKDAMSVSSELFVIGFFVPFNSSRYIVAHYRFL